MNTSNNKTAYNYHFLTREDVINLLEQKDMELKSKDVELKSKNVELKQKDAELKQKDAELARKSQRILELERMVFGRRSENRLPESPNGWAGSFFDKDWAKEGKQLSGEIPTIIKEVEKQAKQRREASRNARSTRKGKTYASYVPNDIERVVTEIYPDGYDENRMVIIGHDKTEHLCLRPSSFYVKVEDRIVCRLKDAKPTDAKIDILEAPLQKQAVDCFADASLLAENVNISDMLR
ncbi:hypothetical protein [Prevotella melaninogenica]|uniref:hypothetical protein n=1 Tax=Prevotella melaninogenica TaxID=28132 RepID=UPI0020132A26|nr:hypothetical protein [Prevotella melaninogenica]